MDKQGSCVYTKSEASVAENLFYLPMDQVLYCVIAKKKKKKLLSRTQILIGMDWEALGIQKSKMGRLPLHHSMYTVTHPGLTQVSSLLVAQLMAHAAVSSQWTACLLSGDQQCAVYMLSVFWYS